MANEFWTGRRKMFWAIGAVLIGLTGAGVVIAYFTVMNKESKDAPRTAARGELSAYLSDEFKAAGREGTRQDQKFPVTDPEQFGESMHNWVGQSITLEEIFPGRGVKLLAAGPATIPGPGKSAHLLLAADPPKKDVKLSLFVKRYMQFPVLDEHEALSLPGRSLGDGAPPITVWRRGGLVYYLVSNSKEGIEVLRQAVGADEPKKPY